MESAILDHWHPEVEVVIFDTCSVQNSFSSHCSAQAAHPEFVRDPDELIVIKHYSSQRASRKPKRSVEILIAESVPFANSPTFFVVVSDRYFRVHYPALALCLREISKISNNTLRLCEMSGGSLSTLENSNGMLRSPRDIGCQIPVRMKNAVQRVAVDTSVLILS